MAVSSDEIKRRANNLWQQALDRLDELKAMAREHKDRLERDLKRLTTERDKLLRQLGDRTQRLANDGTIQIPRFLKDAVNNLNQAIDRITTKREPAKKRTSVRKKVARRRAKKASA